MVEAQGAPRKMGGEPSQDPSDLDLARKMAEGDADALRDLYRRLSALAYSLALRIVGNEADAQEVIVDAFYQAWKQADQYDAARATVTGWVLNITRSRAIDLLRSRRRAARREGRVREPGFTFHLESPPTPEQHAIREDTRARLRRVVAELPEDQRWAVELAYFSGLSQSQIAERLGQPLGTIKTRLRLAMEKMRRAVMGEDVKPDEREAAS